MTLEQFSNLFLSERRNTSLSNARQSQWALNHLSSKSLGVFPTPASALDPILRRKASILLAEAFIHLLYLADFLDCPFSDLCDYAMAAEHKIKPSPLSAPHSSRSPLLTMDPIVLTEAPLELIAQLQEPERQEKERTD